MKLKSVKIVLTFFLLWITTQFDSKIEDYLAYTFILSLGVLHGSNDIKLARNLNRFRTDSYIKILFIYVGLISASFIIFLIIPKITLILFMLISSYHFGEQHLEQKAFVKNKVKNLVYVLYGLVIFSMIFYTNFKDVSFIVENITTVSLEQQFYAYMLLTSLILMCALVTIFKSKNLTIIRVLEEIAYLVLFYILFINSTLLWSFAIYFIVWHSIPSLKDQIINLYGTLSSQTILTYMKESFIYWAVSIIGIVVLNMFSGDNLKLFNLLFVALLSAITFPHVIIVALLERKNKELS